MSYQGGSSHFLYLCLTQTRSLWHSLQFGTGRVYMWRELGVRNSYTMEATFCGSLLGKQSGHHFNTADLETMGRHLCDTLLEYCDPDQTKVGVSRGRVHLVMLTRGYLCVYSTCMSVRCLAWMCVHLCMWQCMCVYACGYECMWMYMYM